MSYTLGYRQSKSQEVNDNSHVYKLEKERSSPDFYQGMDSDDSRNSDVGKQMNVDKKKSRMIDDFKSFNDKKYSLFFNKDRNN